MNLIQHTLAVITLLRTEKDPPITRYAVLLALADGPLTAKEISEKIKTDTIPNGTIDCALRAGFIARTGPNFRKFQLTPMGIDEVRRLATAAA